jgi:hypothetical protein
MFALDYMNDVDHREMCIKGFQSVRIGHDFSPAGAGASALSANNGSEMVAR